METAITKLSLPFEDLRLSRGNYEGVNSKAGKVIGRGER